MVSIAYKIEDESKWLDAMQLGVYNGSELDLNDGFIHLSTIDQLQETLNLYFKGQKNLIIAKIDLNLCKNLLWEPSRGGILFPHLYTPLEFSAVISHHKTKYNGDIPQIPDEYL